MNAAQLRVRWRSALAAASIIATLAITAPVANAATSTSTTLDVPTTVYAFAPTVLAATVSPVAAAGSMRFSIVRTPGGTPGILDSPLDASGRAEININDFGGGFTYALTATYSGNSSYSGSSATTQFTVVKQLLSLQLTVDTPTIHSGQDMVVRAQLTPPPADYPDQPQVHFALVSHGQSARYDANVAVDDQGVATLRVPSTSLVPELWQVTAWFGPTRRYEGTPYVPATFRYEPVPPLVTLAAQPDPAYVGDPVTITASIDPVPDGGSVELFAMGPVGVAPQSLGTVPVDSAGDAVFVRSFAQNAGLQLRAVFSGTSTLVGSQSPIFERGQIGPPDSIFDQVPNTWEPQDTGYFRFHSIDNTNFYQHAVRFECQLDGSAWATCVSPYTTGYLADGSHTFGVRGIDANDRTEPSPEYLTWHIDTTAPSVTAVFNNGSAYTNKNVIPGHFDASDASPPGVLYMALCGTSQVTALGSVDCPVGPNGFHADFNYDLTRASNNNTPGDGVKTIYFNVADEWNHWSSVQSATITYDTTAPGGVTPTIGIVGGRFSSKIPVQLTWPVASDNVSGIAAYKLQRRIDAGSMVTLNGSTPLAMSYLDQLTIGTKYGYQMRALDKAGNGGAWSTPFYCIPTLLQDGGAGSTTTGKWVWTSVSDSAGGTTLRTSKGGSSISTTFTGRSFAWVSTTGSSMGLARIYVDGATLPVTTVDLYASLRTTRQIVWSINFTSGGTHTIKIVAVGTIGHPSVDVDAFLVLRNP